MAIAQKTGFKRLAILISVIAFIVAYIVLTVNERSVNDKEALILFPIISLLVSLGVYLLIRSVYWVIDGFQPDN